jgi:threonine/homoserine/homoserine lactone efflux protein
MIPAIGDVLPLAVGVAISPIPIIAATLMLLSPRARSTSLGFLVGWVVGVAAAVTLFTLLSRLIPETDPDASQPVAGTIKLILGALLLLLAVRQWRARPAPGQTASLPRWMSAVDTMTFPRALALGLLLSAVNPKNLVMAVGAGVSVASAGLNAPATITVLAVFVLIAVSTVLVPVLAYLVAATSMRQPLARLRAWLVQNNTTMMSTLLLVIGVVSIGKGLASY